MSGTPEPPRGERSKDDKANARAAMIGAGSALVIVVTIGLIVTRNPAMVFLYFGLAPVLVAYFRN